MIPATFDYHRPSSLDDALALLAEHAGTAKIIAGGQSLLPLMKLRLAQPERLIDIGRLDGSMRGIRELPDGGLELGALTTYAEVLDSTKLDFVRECLEGIGDVQVRNRGTLGGAIAHADPASDAPALALALDYSVVLRSRRGERVVPLDGFFRGAFETAMEPDEILVSARRPALPQGVGGAYRKIEQPASGYSIVGVAAILGHAHGVYGSSTIDHVRVAITGVGEVAYRAKAVEAALTGTDCSIDQIRAAAAHAADGVTVNNDIHADREYRTAMAVEITRRALEAARARSS
jgi:carbon-monoxide dehydrogenase medium subunit